MAKLPEVFVAAPAWIINSKENLDSQDVLYGLLDYGLFAEKIPPCFSSLGLADIASHNFTGIFDETNDNKLKSNLAALAHDYIRYEALRDINVPRHMGIPHPEAYAIQVLAISKNWEDISKHCNKPNPSISRIHVRHIGDGSIFEMNYKGDESFEQEEELQEWMAGAKYFVETDISACFPSIYTHSIPWALHTKAIAKKSNSITKYAGNLLDRCTQNSKDRQTNGLIIGPHASNIISEIILTCIDKELQDKGFKRVERHIDDYKFYAETFEEAELFIQTLGLSLRSYELFLNEKKTRVLELPRPSEENWRLLLNRFQFPVDKEITFSTIRSYLDLALECSQSIGKSSPLNYAIKTIANKKPDLVLNVRAKRMYAQEAMNLALAYPYLVPLLDSFVFSKYWHPGLADKITKFCSSLISLGTRKLYPDTIAHALYLTLKYDLILDIPTDKFNEILSIDDCIANVLLWEYANKQNLKEVISTIKSVAENLKSLESRDKDKQWLLIYQLWTDKELADNSQQFLARLKQLGFKFFNLPEQQNAE